MEVKSPGILPPQPVEGLMLLTSETHGNFGVSRPTEAENADAFSS